VTRDGICRRHLDEIPEGEPLRWGNSVYSIEFEERERRPVFGHRYKFFLRDAVDDVPEYVVRWDNFQQLAAEQGLHLVYRAEFHEVYQEHCDHREYGPLLVRMKVQNEQGESQMDEDQWEAASELFVFRVAQSIVDLTYSFFSDVYLAFAFEKR
jgi:mRNA (guanine-N7-)-methyltransferase